MLTFMILLLLVLLSYYNVNLHDIIIASVVVMGIIHYKLLIAADLTNLYTQ